MTPDHIYYNGKILTVDKNCSIQQAFAVSGDRFLFAGSDEDILGLAGSGTERVNLQNRTVVPGLADGHCHPSRASLTELEEEIPVPRSVQELLGWVREQVLQKPAGEWIVVPRIFGTRLKEFRLPSKSELDAVATCHPVFLNSSFGGVVNSAGLKRSGINRDTRDAGVLKDDKNGEPTGIFRKSAFGLLKGLPVSQYTDEHRRQALRNMLFRYNQVGITSVTDTAWSWENLRIYQDLIDRGELTVRVFMNYLLESAKTRQDVGNRLRASSWRTGEGNEWLRMGPVKVFLDGGILTGTAYLRQPWGKRAAEIFGIDDPEYRGIVNFNRDQLTEIVQEAHDLGWSFTAHVTGGGGVDILLDAYAAVKRHHPVKDNRFSIIHGNFLAPEVLRRLQDMGVVLDMQPAWFFKDADAMREILGEERISFFHPYRSILEAGVVMCSGSDHMAKLDARSAINPYDPFIGIYTLVTHRTSLGTCIFPEQAISRMDALKTYTINNAIKTGEKNIKGSIEPGKLADFVILEKDFLSCDPQDFLNMEVNTTVVGCIL